MCELTTCKFQNFTAAKSSTTPRRGTDLTVTTFCYRKRPMISFWDVYNTIEHPQNTHFLQLEREFLRYELDILRFNEVSWWNTGEYFSPSCDKMLLYCGKSSSSRRESGVVLFLSPVPIGLTEELSPGCT